MRINKVILMTLFGLIQPAMAEVGNLSPSLNEKLSHVTLHNQFYLAENKPAPTSSTLSNANTAAIIDTFPDELPATLDSLPEKHEMLNTPEYVIIRASEQTTFSSETTAQVGDLNIKEGSYFNQGDLLLKLDCREQQAELNKVKAQQTAAREAEISAEHLKSYGSISEQELVKAQSEAAMVNADVDKLTIIVDKCTIRAPYKGAVSELFIHAHESVKPGDRLLTIVNTDNLELQMQIPSSWLQWVRIGSKFTVHVSEIDKVLPAKVAKINPQIDSVSQTVKITGIITEHSPDLLPGMSGQAHFPNNPAKKS